MTSCLHELRNPSLIKNRLLLVAYGCNQMLPTAIFSTPFMVIDKTGVTSDWVNGTCSQCTIMSYPLKYYHSFITSLA